MDHRKPDMTREAAVTLAMHGLFIFGSSASLTFFNIYFLRLSESFILNLIYNALMYFFTPAGFWAGGWIAKRYDRLYTFRISLVMYILFFAMILALGEGIVAWYGLIAFFQGLAAGLYWSGFLVLQFDVSSRLNRLRYIGISSVVLTLANLLGPLVGGQLINGGSNLTGYLYAFAATLAFFIVVYMLSFLIGKQSARRRRYLLALAPAMARRNPMWSRMLALWFCTGFLEGLILFIPALLLFAVFERESVVSVLLAANALVSALSSWVISRFGRMEHAQRCMMAAPYGIALGALLLSGGMGAVQVVLFLFIVACLNPVYRNMFLSRFYHETDQLPLQGAFRIESIVLYESLLNFGRIVPITALLPFADSLRTDALWMVFLCAGVLQGTAVWLTFRAGKKPYRCRKRLKSNEQDRLCYRRT